MSDANTTGFRVVRVDIGTNYHWFHAVSDTVYNTETEANTEERRLESISIADDKSAKLRCSEDHDISEGYFSWPNYQQQYYTVSEADYQENRAEYLTHF